MGLSHPVTFVSSARELSTGCDWLNPPRVQRTWSALLSGADEQAMAWRARTLKGALDGVGLRSGDVDRAPAGNRLVGRPLSDCVHEADGVASTMVLRHWPREVAPGWLGNALAEDLPVDVAIHVQPQDPQRIARFLKRQQAWQDDGGKDAANELGRRDAETTRQKLIARTDRPVKVAVALTVRGKDREQLRHRTDTLRYTVGLNPGAELRLAKYEQDRGLLATTTDECKLLGAWRTLDCTSVAATWLFQPATVDHEHGARIGTTHQGSMLVRLDPFDLSLRSFGGLITGSVGSGKSFLLKLLLMGLRGCETIVVEQSDPPEYAGVLGVKTFSLADLSEREQAAKLREFVTNLWNTARRDPRPRLLVLDELWSLIKREELATLVEEVARRGRKFYLSLWIATQQIEELLESAKAVFDNAALRVYLQQENRDIAGLAAAAKLSTEARRFLRGAARGQALLDVNGMLVAVDIQATPAEYQVVNTDPREVHRGRTVDDSVGSRDGRADALPGGAQDRERDFRSGDRPVPVAAVL